MNEEAKKNVELKLREYFSKLQDVFHFSDKELIEVITGSAVIIGFEREQYLQERDEARAIACEWYGVYRKLQAIRARDVQEARRIALQMMDERDAAIKTCEEVQKVLLYWFDRAKELEGKYEPDRSQPFSYTTPTD